MKKATYLIILFFATIAVTKGQTSNAKREVAAAVESLNSAMITPNKAMLEGIVASGLSYGHSSGLVQNKTVFIDDLINGPFDFLTINISDQTIEVIGEVAIVRQIFASSYKNKGVPGDLKIGNMLVWHKEDGKWKLLARQAFKL